MTESVCGNNVVDSETCDIQNFPLQKWVCLNISLRSNVLDIFMDGSLVKSCILEGYPKLIKEICTFVKMVDIMDIFQISNTLIKKHFQLKKFLKDISSGTNIKLN